MENSSLLKDLNETQKTIFATEFKNTKKKCLTAMLLALLLGGLGMHHFYMRRVGLGFVYVLFCWTLIPTIISVFELILIPRRVRIYNHTLALDILGKINSIKNIG